MTVQDQINDNLQIVRDRIARSAMAASRDPKQIELVAVTKYVGVDITEMVLEAGCHHLGESRPQQLFEKVASPNLANAQWHLIGHLQRNKIRKILPLTHLIHSVDSLRLLRAIDRIGQELQHSARVLLEINCSGDAAKHGLTGAGLFEILPHLADLSHVEVCGLMTMAARQGGEKVAAENFAALRTLRDEAARQAPTGVHLKELSMGMTGDFETAIREGATIVRIGSLLLEGVES
jgi:pyridoxal phosphate enzyme (YggS family)